MRRNKYVKGNPQLRKMLVREAARLMYEEGVDQYYDAKLLAVKRILGQGKRRVAQPRHRDLPSNGEISNELQALAQFHEGERLTDRLFTMRVTALEVMSELTRFSPRLIGSVSTGKIRKGSDIDLHVFTDSLEELTKRLAALGWAYERQDISIRKGSVFRDFTHIYLDKEFPIELSVYPIMELRVRARSSTDGKPIVRFTTDRLFQVIMEEHGDAWEDYIHSTPEKPTEVGLSIPGKRLNKMGHPM